MVASQALANAKTAEEYVNKAMEMRHKYDHTTPSSSFVKYDIFENVETKHLSPSQPPSQIEYPIQKKATTELVEKSAPDYEDSYEDFRRPDFLRFNAALKNFKEQDNAGAYSHQYSDLYDPFAANDDKSHMFQANAPRSVNSNYPSKAEVFRQIEKSVLKYMRELEADGKLPGVSNRPVAHAEIKTYYRFPTSTVASPSPATKIVNTGTHSEFFKTTKHGGNKVKYSTIKPFTADTFIPENIDLTIPGKKRPKPVDLDALDVGQTWLHSNEQHSHGLRRKPGKPKLHFNSQTYQDINALSFPPNKGPFDEDNVPYSSQSWSDQVNSPSTLNIKEGAANVGASISFGHNQEAFGSEDAAKAVHGQYIPSVQIINGVPVANPYKFHMDTLK